MAITPEQARAELARRELARRELARRQATAPIARTQSVEQEIAQRPKSARQELSEMFTAQRPKLTDEEQILQNRQPLTETIRKAFLPLEAGRETILGIPSTVALSLAQGRSKDVLKDVTSFLAGERNVVPSDVAKQMDVPGFQSGVGRFALDNPDAAYYFSRAIPSLVKAGISSAKGGSQAIGQTLERFGLKSQRTSPTNPTVDDLAKMSPTDRSIYMHSQRQYAQARFQTQLTSEQNRLRKAGEQLASQIESAGKEAVLKARPALANVMGKASPEWRKLVQESLDEAGDVRISPSEIYDELLKKFGGNEGLAKQALSEIDVELIKMLDIPAVGKVGLRVQPLDAKEVFTRLNAERLDIPFTKRAGQSLYGQREFFKDSIIESLTNLLNKHGVDFSRANQFWAPYAQMRNSLFRQIKPFLTEPFETETGARLLTRAAQGKGKAAEVAELERRTGQDLTSRLRNIKSRQEATKISARELPSKVRSEEREFLGELTRKGLLAKGKAEAQGRSGLILDILPIPNIARKLIRKVL